MKTLTGATRARAEALFHEHLDRVYRRRDLVFAWLMAAQWVFGLALALIYSPLAWSGKVHSTHVHVYSAVFAGAALSGPSILLALFRPGWVFTRHAVAAAQMLWSALLIHLTGGRIETHFHVFGSLAFLAFYRDVKVLITATLIVAGDHLARGLAWPESVYGITNPEWWRFLEHAFWVVFENVVLVMGIAENLREMKALAARRAEMEALHEIIEQKVVLRTQELAASREEYRSLVETTQTVPWRWYPESRAFTYVGPRGGALLGCTAEAWLEPGFFDARVHPDDLAQVVACWSDAHARRGEAQLEFRMRKSDGGWVWVRSIVSGINRGDAARLQGFLIDVTERRRFELELRQAQKLESVGRLAAGVAHEINTPIQFVSDSVHFVRDAAKDLFGVLSKLELVQRSVLEGEPSEEAAAEAERARAEADLDYLAEHVPRALERSIEGLNRVAAIVRSMKEFAHPDQREMASVDLNHAVESTLTIAHNEYKYVAEVETAFGDIPRVTCHAGEVNQAILNIVVNAAHAIQDVVRGTEEKGKIRVSTRREGEHAVVEISDTGGGIPEDVRDRIFDPFFTTKEVGKGSGQGLAIARAVIIEKHGGELSFESELGKGTTFTLRLPIDGAPAARARAA